MKSSVPNPLSDWWMATYDLILASILVLCLLVFGCGHVRELIPIETTTKQGEVIKKIEPERTGDREEIPVGVKPSEVVAKIETKTGGKVWIVKKKGKTEVYENKKADEEGIIINRPKKSYKLIYMVIGIVIFLIVANIAIKSFLGFNPIAKFFEIIGNILSFVWDRIRKK